MTKIEKWLTNQGYNVKTLNHDTREYKVTNLDQAAAIIQEAIAQGRTIYVLADYDCDGIMSGCILYTIFLLAPLCRVWSYKGGAQDIHRER